MSHPYLDSYPYLDQLLGAYFHQDFDIVSGETIEAVIEDYKQGTPEDEWGGLRADIKRFIRYSGEALDREFEKVFNPCIDPKGWNMTTKEWLLKVHELMA